MKPWQLIIFGILLGLIIAGILLLIIRSPLDEALVLLPVSTPQKIFVQVSGSVNQPGIYQLVYGSRVIDAVNAAGGLSPEANSEGINLVARVNDGSLVRIPSLGEIPITQGPLDSQFNSTASLTAMININICSQSDLEVLPGIGTEKAADIIAYRIENGPFMTIEDIMDVPGIGPSIFEKIKDLISVN